VSTKPEHRTHSFYEELEILFNYIDYQLRKKNINEAAPAILELYSRILFDSFLKNKKSAFFQDYIDLAEESQIDMNKENNLISLIYILSNRHKQFLFGVPSNDEEKKYYKQRKKDLLLLKDSFNQLDSLYPNRDFIYKIKTRNEHYNLEKAFSINPSSQNCYFTVSKQIIEIRKKIKQLKQYTKEYWGPDIKNVFEYYSQNNENRPHSYFEEIQIELNNAIDIVKTAMESAPNVYYLYELIGELNFLINEKKIAKEFLLKSIELNPNHALAWKILFELLFETNDFHLISQYAEENISFDINSDIDYDAYRQIARIGLKAFGEIKEYVKGIDFYIFSENSFSNYNNRRNNEIQRWSSGYFSFSHPTSVLYNKLPIGPNQNERLKVLEMIMEKVGYNTSLCEDYLLSYLACRQGTILNKLNGSELKNICIEEDKNIPIKYFSMYGFESELKFGKHKGDTISEIIKSDFSYLEWCVMHIGGFYLSPIILTKLILEDGDKHIDFIELNMAKHYLLEHYEQEEYEREEGMKSSSDDNSYGYWMKYAHDEYKDFGGIE
jgi:hypothetical protein